MTAPQGQAAVDEIRHRVLHSDHRNHRVQVYECSCRWRCESVTEALVHLRVVHPG